MLEDFTHPRELLDKVGVVPSRRLGQNFLCDPACSRWIVEQLGAGEEDAVIEIGPGLGALTEHLVGRVKSLTLLEKDRRLAAYLEERFEGRSEVRVEEVDAVTWDGRVLFPAGPTFLIGNLPYSAATPILRNFMEPPTAICGAVLMLQKEVADRLLAKPRSKSYGPLTLGVGVDWEIEPLRTLGPEPFWPPPKIDSSIIRLTLRKPESLPVYDRQTLMKLVRSGFSQRRKQLKKLLPSGPMDWPELAGVIDAPLTARAEELSLEQWVGLARCYDGMGEDDAAQSGDEIFDLVDEDDVVIGQEKRSVVHAEGLRHRAVHLFIFDKKGQLYLQQRSHLKDTSPRLWGSSASGHVDAGESYVESAHRELAEELCLSGVELEEIGKLPPSAANGQEFVTVYQGQLEGKIRTDPREIEAGAFFPLDLVRKWVGERPEDFSGGFVECLGLLPLVSSD